jgi:hypothetical protein
MTQGRDPEAVAPGVVPRSLLEGTSPEKALHFFDSLAAVTVEEMIGTWRATVVPTGHPLEQVLKTYGWHGKRFHSEDAAYPLIFDAPGGLLVNVNPALLPLGLLVRFHKVLKSPFITRMSYLVRPIFGTRRPTARLRMVEYRGVLTGTVVYDDLPVNDAFRSVDVNTLMGAMDWRGSREPLLFILRREGNVRDGRR